MLQRPLMSLQLLGGLGGNNPDASFPRAQRPGAAGQARAEGARMDHDFKHKTLKG